MAEMTSTIDMQMSYQELRKIRCEWCAKEWPLSFPAAPTHTGYEHEGSEPDNGSYNGTGVFRFHPCTAPTAEAAYAEARAQVAALTAERDATDEKHDQIRRIAEAVWNGLNEKTLAHIARLEAELAAAKRVIDASRCIRHWHDSGPNNEGMVVSAEHVRALWITIADYDAARSPEGTEGKDKDEGI